MGYIYRSHDDTLSNFDAGYDIDSDYAAYANAELNNFEYCDASDPDILAADSIW